MKMYKVIGFVLLLLFSLVGVNSALTDELNADINAYWTLDSTTISDNTGNYSAATNGGSTLIEGIISNGRDFNGINQTINFGDIMDQERTNPFTIQLWVNTNATSGTIVGKLQDTGSYRGWEFEQQGTGTFIFYLINDLASNRITIRSNSAINNGSWNHIVVTSSGSSLASGMNIYINGVNDGFTTITNTLTGTTLSSANLKIGSRDTTGGYWDGNIDEFAMWNKELNTGQIGWLYQNGTPTTNQQYLFSEGGSLTIDDINLVNNTYSNSSSLPIALNISATDTNTNINTTLYLSNGSSYDIGTNTQNVSYTLTGIQEGIYNLWTYSFNNETNVTSSNFTYNFDLTQPTITNNIPSEINSYNFLSSYFSCSDTNLLSCNISINGLNKAQNTNFTLTNNGNLSYTITAIDLAGNNIVESGVVLVNPYWSLYFQLTNGTSVTSFTLNSNSYTTYANGTYYNDVSGVSIGSNTLLFEKLGYSSKNITFTLATTGTLNQTFNITQSTIVLRIFNGETNTILTGTTSITLIGTNGYNSTTTTGYLNISNINFINEQYQIIATHTNYTTESIYFNFDNQEILSKDIYLLNSTATNIGYVTVQVTADTGQLIQDALCLVLEWKPFQSAYVSVAEGNTNTEGKTNLNILLNTNLYKFQCSKSGVSATTSSQIIQTTGTLIPIQLSTGTTTPTNIYGSLTYNLTNTTLNVTHQLITFSFSDSNNLVTQACINTYKLIGTKQTLLSSNCSVSASGQLLKIVNINNTYTLQVVGLVYINGLEIPLDSIIFKGTGNLTDALHDYHLDLLIPLLFLIIGVSIGLMITPQNIFISIIGAVIMVWASVVVVPSIISTTMAIFITFICGLMLYGGHK